MTAVEWLIEELKKVHHPTEAMIMYAKKLEKQQIKDAYWGGLNGSINDYSESKKVGSEIIDIKYGKGAEQYYNETYGSKGSDVMTPENHIGVLSEAVRKETTSSQTEISKEEQKEKIVQIMEADAKDGLYKTEISDEEIRKAAIEYANNVYDQNDFKDEWRGVLNDFIAATKWYREQLKISNQLK
jgi:hypothetical protein